MKRSKILDQISRLKIGDSLVFTDDQWDLKSDLSGGLHGRFMGNRRFDWVNKNGKTKITRLPLRRMNFKSE